MKNIIRALILGAATAIGYEAGRVLWEDTLKEKFYKFKERYLSKKQES